MSGDGVSMAEKVYNELKERGIEYNALYTFADFDDMVGEKLTSSQRSYIKHAVNHDYMLTHDDRMLVPVMRVGYRIAPQCVQYNKMKWRGRRAERQVSWGIKETACMETDLLTVNQLVSRDKSLDWGNMTLAAMQRSQQILNPSITKKDVQDIVKETLKNVSGGFDGKFKFK